MPLPTVSFLVGLVVTAYLGTFVLFALLRIVTGISIQRVGYSGFRRIAFSPSHGVRIHVRGIGLSVHRPTFAQPTWFSLNITEPEIVLDLRELSAPRKARASRSAPKDHASGNDLASKWEKLTAAKEKVKKLHRQVKWIKHVDLVVIGARIKVQEIGSVGIERLTLAVDTRAKLVDRSRLFQHHKAQLDTQTPAEWKSIIRSISFTPEGRDSTEILDYCTFSVHGFLHLRLDGLRDASISLKLGRLTVPYDDIIATTDKVKIVRHKANPSRAEPPTITINDQRVEETATLDDRLVETVAGSQEFVSSIIRGIQEVQLAVGFLGFSQRLHVPQSKNCEVYFHLAMKEVGLDVTRLDSRSPAHRMYFSPKDVAHQALLTAISISAGIDDGHDHPERVLYVPMITATVKTTLPSKTLHYDDETDASERNSNILFANFVCTSPSLDLDPKHLPVLMNLAKSNRPPKSNAPKSSVTPGGLVSRLLPRAIIKMAIQEPVVRVSLPPLNPASDSDADFDLLISSTSTMALDIEASHSGDAEARYSLLVNYRQSSLSLYYQSNAGEKHDLLLADTVEVKFDVNALPVTTVHASARFQSFSLFLVRPEISEGIREIMKALKKEAATASEPHSTKKPSFLRQVPSWLEHVNLQGSDFNFELAGIDTHVSKYSRGFALQLESWSAEYKAHRDDVFEYVSRRRSRSFSRSLSRSREERSLTPNDLQPKRKPVNPTDGRRLAIHLQGLEGLIIDSVPDSAAENFVTLPKFELAFSTSTDPQGPLFHINSHAKSLQIQYSVYNHFALGVAILTFRRMFLTLGSTQTEHQRKEHGYSKTTPPTADEEKPKPTFNEVVTVDFKANLLQFKAKMPSDPPLMVQIFGLHAGRHRWANPFVRSKVVRLYSGTPGMLQVWSRIVSLKNLRLDLREMRYKSHNKHIIEEKSIDVSTDAIRLGVPHGLVLHSIFDNIINVVKTTEQMHHHFKTGSEEYILSKHPEGPKKVPRISVRSQVVVFEIEDSPFEWKLGTIYRSGLIEQQQRIARAEAFRLKVKRMESIRQQRASSRPRTSSAQPSSRSRSQSRRGSAGVRRSKSLHATIREESPDDHRGRGRKMRYDAEGKCDMSGACHISVEKAEERLQRFNADSWKKRIDRAISQQNHIMKDLRGILWGIDDLPEEAEQTEPIVAIPQRPALMAAVISDLGIVIDKPSFPMSDLSKFLHDIGKGMPMDTQYGLLVPMHLKVTMGETRLSLRDYPLPFLHVPATRMGQSPRLPSLQLDTDFVIAEEFQGIESQRHINVVICPEDKLGEDDIAKRFAIDVRRTISAIKTYSDMKFEINTSSPTRITWGTSYQPAIQDMMQVIENFTKPPMDPSERVGFWDKIRLSFHSRIDVAWKGDGDVHLNLKGSRSPYVVTGNGAGFVMVWRNNVRFRIAQDEDPRKFMTVDSGEYLLAVPDFNTFARQFSEEEDIDANGTASTTTAGSTASFKKVVMKLSGNVRWMAGLMFERNLDDGKRTFNFCPHYKVVLKHPDYAKPPPGHDTFDAFRTFRSHHIHMSIAVAAPVDRDWNVSNLKPSRNYNSVHLTPRFFTHFFDWWSLFSGVMSLPVRQGPLWGNVEKSSKKFGRHLATIKYNLLFSPLFISHVYKHKDAEEYASDVVSATGLKMRLDSFMVDLHQRRETFEIPGHGDAKPKRTSQMKINQSQLDFISADIRAVSAIITGTNSKDIDEADDLSLAAYQAPLRAKIDMSKFTIPDNDFSWIDMDDFVELDWILPAESNPETKILPLTFGPRFTYFRQTDHGDSVSGDPTRTSPFGDEPTHFCVMSKKNEPLRVQAELVQARIARIVEQIEHNERAVLEQEMKVLHDRHSGPSLESLQALRDHTETLQKKHTFLEEMLKMIKRLEDDTRSTVPAMESLEVDPDLQDEAARQARDTQTNSGLESSTDFNNRFVLHNPQIKWNNPLRNIILRYIHQVGQRRGFVYYMSRRAVKFILDIVEERQRAKESEKGKEVDKNGRPTSPTSPDTDDMEVQERIEELLRDGKQFVNADDADDRRPSNVTNAGSDGGHHISTEFTPQNIYHFRLIAPQIQLQSEKNPKSVVLIAAKGMQFKVVQIMDKDRIMDEVSGLVQRRFSANMDSLQVFVSSTKTFSTEYLHMYSGNHYGGKKNDYWPPWVPLEVMFEFSVNPYGFDRVVHRTSANLRYDKYNNLRLKYNDDVTGGEESRQKPTENDESRLDHIWIEFPHFRAICDSHQYYAMYVIALDLLLYSEPLEKTRSERLEKIMLASDFSDLSGAPEMVEMLQGRIRQLEDIKMHFQINESLLDRQGWKDRIAVDQDLASCEDELFFIMKAITTSQRRIEDRNQDDSSSPGILRWLIASKEIAWHLVRDKSESLVEFQLRDAQFARTDNNDGSNYNCIEIGRINGFNLLPNAVYPEIIAPYVDPARGFPKRQDIDMLRVQWLQLEAIAGIQVVDYFEVNVMPLRVQLEREVAKKLFEYIFPGVGGTAFEGSVASPFAAGKMSPTKEEDDEDADSHADSSDLSPTSVDDRKGADPGGVPTVTGDLEQRLHPTMKLTDSKKSSPNGKRTGLGVGNLSHSSLPHWNLFHNNKSQNSVARKQNGFANSPSNLSMISKAGSDKSLAPSNDSASVYEERKRPGTSGSTLLLRKKEKEQPSDDLTQMMDRASNYMTLAYFKIPSTVLCLSYKGRGTRNIEDVHDLVFRLPTFEYRNKTWSNLDLALQIKKDLIKALISHTGAIIGNKFSHHRPSRQQAQSRLKEIANMSTLLSIHDNGPDENEELSLYEQDAWESRSRLSFQSGRASNLDRSVSRASSSNSNPLRKTVSSSRSLTPGVTPLNESHEVLAANGGLNGHNTDELRPHTHAGETSGHGHSHMHDSDNHHHHEMLIGPPPGLWSVDKDPSRNRSASIGHRFSIMGQKLRQSAENAAAEDNDDSSSNISKTKSKLLAGGQKLLNKLPHSNKSDG
ncbi:hypothetical protein AAFC00_003410 [Neodothiora populina]|uniref:Uncharacterized protein n=1 Tax=Neodothiora populina TaxID=2781224 RepID=A0ABR3PE31_9PEZI